MLTGSSCCKASYGCDWDKLYTMIQVLKAIEKSRKLTGSLQPLSRLKEVIKKCKQCCAILYFDLKSDWTCPDNSFPMALWSYSLNIFPATLIMCWVRYLKIDYEPSIKAEVWAISFQKYGIQHFNAGLTTFSTMNLLLLWFKN